MADIIKLEQKQTILWLNQIEQTHISSIVYSELCNGIELREQHLMETRWKQLNEFISLFTLVSREFEIIPDLSESEFSKFKN